MCSRCVVTVASLVKIAGGPRQNGGLPEHTTAGLGGAVGDQGARTGTFAVAGINLLAVRSAVARAHRPLVIAPTVNTAAPQPAMISHPTWLASAKPSLNTPARTESTADPTTATPSDVPI
jgi:hypothetical protein